MYRPLLHTLTAAALVVTFCSSSAMAKGKRKKRPPPLPKAAEVSLPEDHLTLDMPEGDDTLDEHFEVFERAPEEDDAQVDGVVDAEVASPNYSPSPAFVKGQLAHVGDTDFYVPRHQIWVGSQYFYTTDRTTDGMVHRTHYMGLAPRVSYYKGGFYASVEVPLAVEIYDYATDPTNPDAAPTGDEFANAGRLATFMWDEPSEYAQVIRYVRYGSKGDPLYVNVSRVAAATLGHGTVLRSYNANLDLNRRYVGAQVDYAHDYGGVEFATSNIIGNDIVGLLAFGRPGAWLFPTNLYARTASVGFSFVADRRAPRTLARTAEGFLVSDTAARPLVDVSQGAPVIGFDGEVKVFKGKRIDVKTYGDYSRLAVDGGGGGWSMGGLGRFNLGEKDGHARHAFRTRAEVQLYSAHYDPGYYDLFYEVQKYQAVLREGAPQQTKLEYVLGREDGAQAGARVEASYALVDKLAVAMAIENNTAGDNSAYVHVEIPTPERLRLMGTAAKVNYDGLGSLMTPGGANSLLMARTDWRPAAWMMVGAEVAKLYRLTSVDADARPAEGQAASFGPGFWWAFDVSVGYEF